MQWNLIRLRTEDGLFQVDMAKIAGISESAYQNKETGKTVFKAPEMFKIAFYFEKPIEEIFLPTYCMLDAN